MNNKSTCTIYLARHGETEWNSQGRIQGQHDTPLTAKGKEQALKLGEKFKEIKFEAIFSSDQLRAKRTAEIAKLDRDLEVITKKVIRERNFGAHDGKLATDYRNDIKDLLNEFKMLPEEKKWHFKFADDYESDFEVSTRFITFLREIAVAYPSKTILVVAHGSAIKAFLLKIGYIKYENIQSTLISNTGYVKLISDGIDFKVEETSGIEQV